MWYYHRNLDGTETENLFEIRLDSDDYYNLFYEENIFDYRALLRQ